MRTTGGSTRTERRARMILIVRKEGRAAYPVTAVSARTLPDAIRVWGAEQDPPPDYYQANTARVGEQLYAAVDPPATPTSREAA